MCETPFHLEEGIPPIAYRKQRHLANAVIPNGTISIGDAAYSLCPLLKRVIIPASVEYIGVAAFCASGLETVTFLGVPDFIEPSAFSHCNNLKQIIVPVGKKDEFVKMLSNERHLIVERSSTSTNQNPPQATQTPHDLGFEKVVKLRYNQQDFILSRGKEVLISKLFSGPTVLIGNPSYQFRRKCLFVFMKSETASAIVRSREYSVPANRAYFARKYREKYGNSQARIFLFVCDNGENASFYDEVRLKRIDNNSILVTSNL